MKITKAEIVISAVSQKQYPKDHLPEIALAGRSNVGKSSLINRLIQRKNLARTSSKPGKTQTLNFYKLNEAFYFVDVPGYGYAKVSKRERNRWGYMMEEYFETRKSLQAILLVVDSRHKPTKLDQQMYDYVSYLQLPVIVVATKFDKVPKSKQHRNLQQITSNLQLLPEDALVPFSAQTGEGAEEIWELIKIFL